MSSKENLLKRFSIVKEYNKNNFDEYNILICIDCGTYLRLRDIVKHKKTLKHKYSLTLDENSKNTDLNNKFKMTKYQEQLQKEVFKKEIDDRKKELLNEELLNDFRLQRKNEEQRAKETFLKDITIEFINNRVENNNKRQEFLNNYFKQ